MYVYAVRFEFHYVAQDLLSAASGGVLCTRLCLCLSMVLKSGGSRRQLASYVDLSL